MLVFLIMIKLHCKVERMSKSKASREQQGSIFDSSYEKMRWSTSRRKIAYPQIEATLPTCLANSVKGHTTKLRKQEYQLNDPLIECRVNL